MSKRASDGIMDALHGLTAAALIKEIRAYQNGERFHPPKYDKEGNVLPPEPMSLPASVIAAAIKFLKDNGIDRPGREAQELDTLAALLPDFDEIMESVQH